jgi:hypothetical protein
VRNVKKVGEGPIWSRNFKTAGAFSVLNIEKIKQGQIGSRHFQNSRKFSVWNVEKTSRKKLIATWGQSSARNVKKGRR